MRPAKGDGFKMLRQWHTAGTVALVLAAATAPAPADAQMPGGLSVLVSTLEPVTEVVADPLTGLLETQTTHTTLIDMKHEDQILFNSCMEPAEPVVINGKQRFTFKTTVSSSGRVHEQSHQESNGTGLACSDEFCTSFTGPKYSFASTKNFTSSSGGPASSSSETATWQEHLVRSGEFTDPLGGDDMFIKFVTHRTMVNGVPTATLVGIDLPVCR